MNTTKPANGWIVKQPLGGMWAAMPADPAHPDWHDLLRYQPTLVRACEYTHLIGPLSDQPGQVEDTE